MHAEPSAVNNVSARSSAAPSPTCTGTWLDDVDLSAEVTDDRLEPDLKRGSIALLRTVEPADVEPGRIVFVERHDGRRQLGRLVAVDDGLVALASGTGDDARTSEVDLEDVARMAALIGVGERGPF